MSRRIDAVAVEIIGNLLLSIAEEAGIMVIHSAYSTNIKERCDTPTATFDPDGNMVVQAEHVAVHLGSPPEIVQEVYKHSDCSDVQEDDMLIGNGPYNGGGTHLSDITVAAPMFRSGRLIDWVANLTYYNDAGGRMPGSTSGDAASIFQKGTRIPLVCICSGDEVYRDIVNIIVVSSRIPNGRYGGLQAQVAANRMDLRCMFDTHGRYGDVLVDNVYQSRGYAERKPKVGIEKPSDDVY